MIVFPFLQGICSVIFQRDTTLTTSCEAWPFVMHRIKMGAFSALTLSCSISGNGAGFETFTTVMFGKNRPYV